jgi:aminoglycoside phosphotransferase
MATPTESGPIQSGAPDNPEDDLVKYKKMPYTDAVIGHELHNFFGGKVIEHVTAAGEVLALKVKTRSGLHRSEADLMHYAASHGVLAPKVRGVYDVQTKPTARVMVSERVPGVPLVQIWQTASKSERASYKEQLRLQLKRMRECTQPFIGRVNKSGERQPTYNIYDRLLTTYCGPFETQNEFEEWCLDRALPKAGLLSRYKWKRFIEREQHDASGRFVLTHGDLTPRNIMAHEGKITGIVDWERGGFFPEYAEYAFAMALGHSIEDWWIPVLKDILQPCSGERVKFTKLVEDRGW